MVFNDGSDRSSDVFIRATNRYRRTNECRRAQRPIDSSEETLRMEPINRRRFLVQGGAVVAAAGVASAVPFSAADALTKGRNKTHNAVVPADAKLDEPVVAHLRDLHTGEVALYKGHTEVTVKDKHLAAILFNASR
jgi:hypothetical protein